MLYLKKILDRFYRELTMDEAIDKTIRGECLTVIVSKDMDDNPGRKVTTTIKGVRKIGVHEDKILVETNYEFIYLDGWDDNKRKIRVAWFEDHTNNRLLLQTHEAMGAVNNGHVVCANDGCGLQTGMIIKFMSGTTFETYSKSVYQML